MVALLALGFVLRVLVPEPGPFFLVPIALAGLWGGARTGAAVGLVGAGLFALAVTLSPGGNALEPATAFAVRAPIFAFAGYLVGRLAEDRGMLAARLEGRDQEIEELRAIQEALAPPEPPERPDVELAVTYLPATDGASGDFYLVAPGPSDDVTIVLIGDVAGKGIKAAQRAAYVRTALATAAPYEDDPGRLLELANQALIEKAGESEEFVTAACVVYEAGRSRVRSALAGHWTPRRLGNAEALDHSRVGRPLGLNRSFECAVESADFSSGDGLLLFTDGLVEARRSNGTAEHFGEGRLDTALRHLGSAPPATVVGALTAAIQDFSTEQLSDDVCMVALRAR